MSQSRHSSTKQQNPDLLTDCASGGVGSRVSSYGYEKTRNPDNQCYSKSSHMLDSGNISSRDIPSSPTDKCLYESGDSGFYSGAINSEQSISSSDDLSSGTRNKNYSDSGRDLDKSTSVRNKNYSDSGFLDENTSSMRLDSDFDLHEQFSELNLKKPHLNDLNAPSPSITSSVNEPCKNLSTVQPAVEAPVKEQHPEFDPLLEYFRQDEDGDTQLHIAIIQGFIEVVYGLIRLAPHPCFLDIPNDFRQTPLHLAVMTSQAPIVRALLVAGACPDLRDRHGNTALHMASEQGATDCVRALIQPVTVAEMSGAELRYSVTGAIPALSSLDERNYDGQLCTHLAAAGGHVDVLRHLFWCGADLNARESKCGRTTLHVAAERGRENVAKFLLTEVANLDLHCCTYTGYTAYQLAYYANPDVARELATLGAAQPLLSDSESDSDSDDEMLYAHLPGEGFFRGLNGAANHQQPISA